MPDGVIVADSSPLIGLARIDQLDLLPKLYSKILVPPAVWDAPVRMKSARLSGLRNNFPIP